MRIWLNGETTELAPGATVRDAVAALTESDRGVAVAVEAEIVPRGDWPSRTLSEGEHVEVVHAIQGG